MGGSNQTLTVNLQQALQVFERLRMQDIRDIRSVDTDLLLVLRSGQQILWQEGSLTVLQRPEMTLLFKDGTLRAEQLFKQIETIDIHERKGEDDSFFDGAPEADGAHNAAVALWPCELGIEQRWVLI